MNTKQIGRREGGVASRLVRTAFERLAWLVLALALSWTCVSVANAKSIYVAPTGTDNAIGTLGWPVRTINQAMKIAVQGDKIIVRDGTYFGVVRIAKGGTSRKPIQIVAENTGMAVIQGTATALDTDLVVISASNVTFSGFAVRYATRSGIAVWNATNVTVANNIISGSQRSGIWAGGPGLGNSKQINITGNTVTNNCLENMARNWSGGWPRAIAVDVSTAITITANIVANNYGEGIGLLSTQGGKITGNVVFDNFSVEIYLDNSPQSTVTGNLVFSTGNSNFFRFDRPAYGVLIANEITAYPLPSKGIKATDNTLIGSGNAIYVGVDWEAKLISCTVSPNTVQPSMPRADLIALISHMVKASVVDLI
jgi:parallel beta-helix repeat protein